jgi:hypothetical protein
MAMSLNEQSLEFFFFDRSAPRLEDSWPWFFQGKRHAMPMIFDSFQGRQNTHPISMKEVEATKEG